MKRKLSPPFNAEDDLVLEIVVFLGTCITDATAAHFVCKTGLLVTSSTQMGSQGRDSPSSTIVVLPLKKCH